MNTSAYFGTHFPKNYQEIIVEGFNRFEHSIEEIFQSYCSAKAIERNYGPIRQLVHIAIVQHLFALNRGQILTLFLSDYAPTLKKYLLNFNSTLFCRSWSSPRLRDIVEFSSINFNSLLEKFVDFFYTTIGERARKNFQDALKQSKAKLVPPLEIFMGVLPPSQIFPFTSIQKRAEIMPYFNAWNYMHIKHISGITELVGEIKTVKEIEGHYVFELAGILGFMTGAPAKGKFFTYFEWIEAHIDILDYNLDLKLISEEIHELTVVSVDGTNIPQDKRDKSASNGHGSRGKFFGQKSSIGCGGNCIPIIGVTKSGNTADAALFNDTIVPIHNLALLTGQDIWAITADAGYTSTYIIEDIIAWDVLSFVDINTRKSKPLKELKEAGVLLQKYSKKAIKRGLTLEERKAWIKEVKQYSKNAGKFVSYSEKKTSSQKSF